MARRGMWLIGGVAVGVGALVLKPDARMWLRRRLGMEPEDRRWFEEDDAQPAEHEGDEPLDTREARFSLRARLAEEGHAEPAAERPPLAAAPPLPTIQSPPAPVAPAFGSAPPAAVPDPEPLASVPEPAGWATERAAEAPASDVETPVDDAVAEVEEAPPVATPWLAAAPEPAAQPEVEREPEPLSVAEAAPAPAFESVPPIGPEDDAPKTPGEDTSEIEPAPAETWQAPEAAPPPPIPLRPPTSPATPPASRPFSESTSFRSAIDAARERVHGAAREATPDEGEDTEPIEERD